MSESKVDLTKLTQPFPKEAIKSRPGGGRSFSYVDGQTVIRRLNAATNNCWNFKVLDYHKDEALNAITARVALELPGLGWREHIGLQEIGKNQGIDAVVKGAISDALKKAATLFGVGLELYGPDFEEDSPAQEAPVQQMRTAQKAQPARTAPKPSDPDFYEPDVEDPFQEGAPQARPTRQVQALAEQDEPEEEEAPEIRQETEQEAAQRRKLWAQFKQVVRAGITKGVVKDDDSPDGLFREYNRLLGGNENRLSPPEPKKIVTATKALLQKIKG